MKNILIILSIFIISCDKSEVSLVTINEIQSISIDTVLSNGKSNLKEKKYSICYANIDFNDTLRLFDEGKNNYELFSNYIANHYLGKRNLDTSVFFDRSSFEKILAKNALVIDHRYTKEKMKIKDANFSFVYNFNEREYYMRDTIGKITLYPVLFDNSQKHAIQVLDFSMGFDMAVGYMFFLRSIDNKWKLVGYKMLWES